MSRKVFDVSIFTERGGRSVRYGMGAGAVLLATVAAGCGGGGGGAATTVAAPTRAVALSFAWPTATRAASTRALPESANSLVVAIVDSSGFADSRTLTRPAAGSGTSTVTASFTTLAPGTLQVTATAFTGQTGQGTLLAQTTTTLNLTGGNTSSTTLAFPDVAFSGVLIVVSSGNINLSQGQTLTLSARGVDASGNLIKTNPPGVWSTSNAAIATVNSSGVVTAVSPGAATITFTDSAFGKSASLALQVGGGDSQVTIQ